MDIREYLIGDDDFNEKLESKIKPLLSEKLNEEYINADDGTRLHCVYMINPAEKAMVVISHGFCEFTGKYHEVMYYFYQMGYSVCMCEYRGHGFSQRFVDEIDKVYVKSYDEYVMDLHATVEKIAKVKSKSGHLILFAHSMGGAIASLYLEKYPDVFEKAVLSSPLQRMNFGKFKNWQVRLLMVISKVLGWDLKYVPGQRGFDNVYVFKTSSTLSEQRYAYVFKQRQDIDEYKIYGGCYAWTRASVKATDKLVKNADRIKTPILLLEAGLDTMVDNDGHEAFIEGCKCAKIIRYADSKHEIFNALTKERTKYYIDIFDFLMTSN